MSRIDAVFLNHHFLIKHIQYHAGVWLTQLADRLRNRDYLAPFTALYIVVAMSLSALDLLSVSGVVSSNAIYYAGPDLASIRPL